MNNINLISDPIKKLILFAVSTIVFMGITGCAGKYGKFQLDQEVYYAFENNTVSSGYKYYSNYQHNVTYAILGMEPKFKLESKMWREVEPGAEDFKILISRIWEDYGRYKYGASVLDPDGNKVGIWYSAVFGKAIKFYEDNRIEVLIDKPFLWGPDNVGAGGDIRVGQ